MTLEIKPLKSEFFQYGQNDLKLVQEFTLNPFSTQVHVQKVQKPNDLIVHDFFTTPNFEIGSQTSLNPQISPISFNCIPGHKQANISSVWGFNQVFSHLDYKGSTT